MKKVLLLLGCAAAITAAGIGLALRGRAGSRAYMHERAHMHEHATPAPTHESQAETGEVEPEPPVPVRPPSVPPITGTVVDAQHSGRVPGARVCALSEGTVVAETLSDGQGRFALAVPEVRRCEIEATAVGYAAAQLGGLWTGGTPVAEPGDDVRIRLVPGLAIRGRVVDAAGRGLAGAVVRGTSIDLVLNRKRVAYAIPDLSAAATRTDTEGRFELGSVPPRGTTTFRVSLDGYEDALFRVDAEAHPPVRDFVVRLDRAPALSGRVLGEDGRALAGAAVMPLAEPVGVVEAGEPVFSGEDGRLLLPWSNLARAIVVWGPGHVPEIRSVPSAALRSGETLEVRLSRAAEILGFVRDELGRPVADARVRLHHYETEVDGKRGRLYAPFVWSAPQREELHWTVLLDRSGGAVAVPEARTDARGAFRLLAGARNGTATALLVEKEGHVDVSALWTDRTAPIAVELPRAVRVVVAAADAETGDPVAAFRVVARQPHAPQRSRPNPARGSPAILSLAPGAATLIVEAEGYAPEALDVELRGGEEVRLDVALWRR